jgi:oligoendopeptidase F
MQAWVFMPVSSGQAGAAKRYLDFLKSGASRYPLEALHTAGVDLTSPEPVSSAFGVLAELVERLGTLVG